MGKNRRQHIRAILAAGLFAAAVGSLLAVGSASGTTQLMGELPLSDRFKCLICHTTASPTMGNAPLGAFGGDFLANGNKWDAVLAAKNSDGDGCNNGFELGDRDGNGIVDIGVTEEQANPGVSNDCAVPISESSWGLIKKLFDE